MSYNILKIATLIGGQRVGNADAEISWLLTDSRSLAFPDETLFFALKSERNDGHKFIADLYKRGVRNFVVQTLPEDWQHYRDVNFIVVKDSLKALQRLAERHRDDFNIPIIGITGSNGKTMVKEWLCQLLSPSMKITRSPRSYNSQIGVPLSVWLLHDKSQVGIFEAGISKPGEMDALHDIIQPTIGVFTNIGMAHQENFTSMTEKCDEKVRLFRDARIVVYNGDDEIITDSISRGGIKSKLAWSRTNPQQIFFISNIATSGSKTEISYTYKGAEGKYTIPFTDEASIECSIACVGVCLYLKLTPETIADRMAKLEPVGMRMEVREGQHGCTLINDSYNSDINSLDIALDFMCRRQEQSSRKRILILSDIFQSGEEPTTLYKKVNELITERGIDQFVGIGTELCKHASLITVADKDFFYDVDDFLMSDTYSSLHNSVILIKGARKFGFEHITEQLVEKVHETVLDVNLNAVVANLNHFRTFMQPETKLVCMIKADGYGAGAVELAKTLQDHNVDYLAIAVADEGAELRKNGIKSNIIVMNPEMSSFKTLFENRLEPEVYSFRLLEALIKAARKEGFTNYPIHIKLDTGMHRLGFNPETDIEHLLEVLKGQTALIPRSVFSHFVGSDSDGFDDFSATQFELFDRASRKIQDAYTHKILRHINNSAGIMHFPERQLDMCRLGLGLYGIDRDNKIINNVSTLKTTILQLRHVAKEDTVGYSRKGTLNRDSVIAAIPIGYADGLNRHLGNRRAYCLVNGKKAEYVGNICMDVALIDVTDIDCKEGDAVEIFGDNLPVTVLSDILDTIPYEVLTSISPRVKRVYFQD
ncbi:MAG: bifunctional UDP-N-acetylmuramoyl-tripeptide:D-alanyl-D-alanine ligase/alanine racemase [Prevotellaceae bacterium]|nr:bifunctional UDP-N-acetylmuramoyl-tripeptide:D-alanyl-D-alanine ligase/alanine racemase [Prevotellaceae bacterium]